MVSRSSARVRPNRRMSSSLIVWSQARYLPPEETQRGMTQVLIRDKPGSSGMTPGCDSRGRNDLRGRGGALGATAGRAVEAGGRVAHELPAASAIGSVP